MGVSKTEAPASGSGGKQRFQGGLPGSASHRGDTADLSLDEARTRVRRDPHGVTAPEKPRRLDNQPQTTRRAVDQVTPQALPAEIDSHSAR